MFGLVVYNCKIDPNYFYDEMTFEELDLVLEKYNEDYKNSWNQTRFISFWCGNVDYKKCKQPKDLITFSWEQPEEEIEIEDIEVTQQKLLDIINLI